MNNTELIKKCRQALKSESEPEQMDWIDMVEGLCGALEKETKRSEVFKKSLIDVRNDLSAIPNSGRYSPACASHTYALILIKEALKNE